MDDTQDNMHETGVEYISKEGFSKLQRELEELKTHVRLKIAERLEYAKSLGDLSENAEFDSAKEDQMLNEMRIRELEDFLSRARIISEKKVLGAISVGSTIIINAGDQTRNYMIVGSEEANPALGKISNESPLGKAFLGRKKGDTVKVVTPKGEVEYVIMEIA